MRTLVLLILSCGCASAQVPTQMSIPKAVALTTGSSSFSYGDVFLFVDASGANGGTPNNNDVVTSLVDTGTNHTVVSYNSSQSGRWHNDGVLSNNLPYILQTNFASGQSGGIILPNPFQTFPDTNFTITFVAMMKQPVSASTPWINTSDSGLSKGYYLLGQSAGKSLESWDMGGTIDVTSVTTVQTNQWVITTLVHSSGSITIYTNNVSFLTGGPGVTTAIGTNTVTSARFLGSGLAGSQFWNGAWKRVMMWKYGLNNTDRTTYYNNLKTELGLSGLP